MAKQQIKDADLISCYRACRKESEMARFDRIQQNRVNFDIYHLRQDWAYKIKGQSREFLPKQAMAVEQSSNFLRQGLIDIGNWFDVFPNDGINSQVMQVKPNEIKLLLERQLNKNSIVDFITDGVKLGFLGSLMIAKVTGEWVPKVSYKVEAKWSGLKLKKNLIKKEDKVWQLKLKLVRQEDWFPDPTGRNMYCIEDSYMDFYDVKMLSEGPHAIYEPEVVKQLAGSTYSNEGYDKEYFKAREAGQNTTTHGYRKQVKLTEYWGNIVDSTGNLIHENIVMTVANDNFIIQPPTPNPLWHGENPYIAAPIFKVPHGVWGKAPMDAPTYLNKAINELMNLTIDGGMMAVHGIKQIREHWLEDASQVDNGIAPGETIRVNAACPPGASALENIITSTVPQETLQVLNLVNQEFYMASMTNDLRMGAAASGNVKATQVAEASQTIHSVFDGMADQIEANWITPLLAKSWKTIAQHTDELDFENLKALFGSARAEALKKLSKEDLFAETVLGSKFKVYGLSAILSKQKDFTKLQAMLQTIVSSPMLMEEFVKQFDFGKVLKEILESLDIDTAKIQVEKDPTTPGNDPAPQVPQNPGVPNLQSQIPQAGSQANNPIELNSNAQSGVPETSFPTSKAVPKGGFNQVPNK